MSIETRLRQTGNLGGGGGGSSNSAGLAGTGIFYLLTTADATLPNMFVIQPGSSITHHLSGTGYYLNATTNTNISGEKYLMRDTSSLLSGDFILRPGSSVTIHSDGSALYINATTSSAAGGGGGNLIKAINVEDPTNAEDLTIWKTPVAITVSTMYAVLVGSNSPVVTWTIRHQTSRNATGSEVVTGGTITTSQDTGDKVTSFNDSTIVADSWIWLETTSNGNTVDELNVSIHYTED